MNPKFRVELNWQTQETGLGHYAVHFDFEDEATARSAFDAFAPDGAFTVTNHPSMGGLAEKRGERGQVIRLFRLTGCVKFKGFARVGTSHDVRSMTCDLPAGHGGTLHHDPDGTEWYE